MDERLITVVETREFQQRAVARMSDSEREAFITYIAGHPEAGDLMSRTGGARKVRWGVGARGKRGGVRVLYYYHNLEIPIFLLTVFAKSEKANITSAEEVSVRKLIALLISEYSRRKTSDRRGRQPYRRP